MAAPPKIVVAADWSTSAAKRWMTRAELTDDGMYAVAPPEPVGETSTLLARLLAQAGPLGTVLIGFDFPIGLPSAYAARSGLAGFRDALSRLGQGEWSDFFVRSNQPTLRQPFFPLPTQEKGEYRKQLAAALGCEDLSELLRACDRKTASRRAAECLFYTLGGAQVGPAAIAGWRDVLQPALADISIWPFDGDLELLLDKPGITVAEIYPAEAYSHLDLRMGAGSGRTKKQRQDRREAVRHLLARSDSGAVKLSNAARSWMDFGFVSEDDFDATVGLLSMLAVATGDRLPGAPDCLTVRNIEGWILGQPAEHETQSIISDRQHA